MAVHIRKKEKEWRKEWEVTCFEFVYQHFWDKVDRQYYSRERLTEAVFFAYPDVDWYYGEHGIELNDELTLEWLTKYPDKPWNWGMNCLSSNNNVSLEWLTTFPDKPWDWDVLSCSPGFDISWVQAFPDKPWAFYIIGTLSRTNFQIEWIDQYPDEDWAWFNISGNINFDISWVLSHPDRNWHWISIIRNKKFKVSWLQTPNPYINEQLVKNLDSLSDNPSFQISWLNMLKDYNINWNWDRIMSYPNVPLSFVHDNLGKMKNPKSLSRSSNITPQFIEEHPEIDWQWIYLSNNFNMTYQFIMENKDKPWDWVNLIQHNIPRIPIHQIEEMIALVQSSEINYDNYNKYSQNILKRFKMIPSSSWNGLLWNKMITFEFALKIKDKMIGVHDEEPPIDSDDNNNNNMPNNTCLIGPFYGEAHLFWAKKQRQYMAVYRIERHWLKARYNPEYALCRKLQHKTYDNLMENKN